MKKGIFVVSLDLELYWGVRDRLAVSQYQDNLDGMRGAVREILSAFINYEIHATWAVVGFVFYKDSKELKQDIPHNIPNYINPKLSSYKYIQNADTLEPAYHFAPDLIDLIHASNFQEIGTHTYSHYYCLEEGGDIESFETDVNLAVRVANAKGIKVKSIIFPRNQIKKEFLQVLVRQGITSFRGNEKAWFYNPVSRKKETTALRAFRLLDAYLNLSGHNTYSPDDVFKEKPYNFPSSRFLRPVSKKLLLFEKLRMSRVKRAMTNAAKNNKIFHIWWHPHNFGVNTDQNMEFLIMLLKHYKILEDKYGMQSLNMGELADSMETSD